MKICLAAPLTNHSLLCTGGVKHLNNSNDNKIKNVFLMKIFLAGGISEDIRKIWQRVMKIYLANPRTKDEVMDAMKVYIAGENYKKKILREQLDGCDFFTGENALKGINILESFYYLRKRWLLCCNKTK